MKTSVRLAKFFNVNEDHLLVRLLNTTRGLLAAVNYSKNITDGKYTKGKKISCPMYMYPATLPPSSTIAEY